MTGRTLHLNVNLLHSGVYPSAWRLPGSRPDAFVDIDHFIQPARPSRADAAAEPPWRRRGLALGLIARQTAVRHAADDGSRQIPSPARDRGPAPLQAGG